MALKEEKKSKYLFFNKNLIYNLPVFRKTEEKNENMYDLCG